MLFEVVYLFFTTQRTKLLLVNLRKYVQVCTESTRIYTTTSTNLYYIIISELHQEHTPNFPWILNWKVTFLLSFFFFFYRSSSSHLRKFKEKKIYFPANVASSYHLHSNPRPSIKLNKIEHSLWNRVLRSFLYENSTLCFHKND